LPFAALYSGLVIVELFMNETLRISSF